jgi:hypothetical protein
VADEPPRGLGGEVDEDEERDGPDPLDGEGEAVGPLALERLDGDEDTGGDELTDNPALRRLAGGLRQGPSRLTRLT